MIARCLECNRGTKNMDIFGLCEVCGALADGSWVPAHELCVKPSCNNARCAGVNYLSTHCREHEKPPA